MVSIHDVARSAGVSHQTVSRVINDRPYVGEATRRRVQWAIQELNYRPNATAQALSAGRGRTVTVLSSDTTLYSRAAILRGIEHAARASGFTVTVAVLDSRRPDGVRSAVERACDPIGAGAVVIAHDPPGIQALRAVPRSVAVAAVLDVGNVDDLARYPSIAIDDRTAAQTATRHLLELGHPTVHYVSEADATTAETRRQGWHAALRAAGARVPPVVPAGWTPRSGYAAARQLATDRRVSAVLCGSDALALGVMRALGEAGRAVPDEVSVVGFDDTPRSAFYPTPLTTVRLDYVGAGRDCFALLHALQPNAPTVPAVGALPELILRSSTGPFRHRRPGRPSR